MRVLITGGAGLLGSALLRQVPTGCDVHATHRSTPATGAPSHYVELGDRDAVLQLWEQLRPDLVIHTAAGTADGERDIVAATRNVADACSALGASLIHLSTDLVFDGSASPYAESVEPRPMMRYGHWKLTAEHHAASVPGAAIVRTSLIVRVVPPGRSTAWLLEALERGERPTLYVDELRCPILDEDLAAQLWELAALPAGNRAGVWHLVGPEAISRYALGLLLATQRGGDPNQLRPGRSPGDRPRDVRLLASRADRQISTRARPISEAFAMAP